MLMRRCLDDHHQTEVMRHGRDEPPAPIMAAALRDQRLKNPQQSEAAALQKPPSPGDDFRQLKTPP
jgi:hypothetical protein